MKKLIAFLSALIVCTNSACLTVDADTISTNTIDSIYINNDILVEFNTKQVDEISCYDSLVFTVPTYYFSENDNYVLEDNENFETKISDSNNHQATIYSGLDATMNVYYEKDNNLQEIEYAYAINGLEKQTLFDGKSLDEADKVKIIYTFNGAEPLITPSSEYADYEFREYAEELDKFVDVIGTNTKVDSTTFTLSLELNNWNKTNATEETYGLSVSVINTLDSTKLVLTDNFTNAWGVSNGYENGYIHYSATDVTEVPSQYYGTMLSSKQCLSGFINSTDYHINKDYYTSIDGLMLFTQFSTKDLTSEGYESADLRGKDYCKLNEPLTQLIDIKDKTGTLIIKSNTLDLTEISVSKENYYVYNSSSTGYLSQTIDSLSDNYTNEEINTMVEDLRKKYYDWYSSLGYSDEEIENFIEQMINVQKDYIEINLDDLNKEMRDKKEKDNLEDYELYLKISQDLDSSLIKASNEIIPALTYTLDYSDYEDMEINYGLCYNANTLSVVNTSDTIVGDLNYDNILTGIDLISMKKVILGMINENENQQYKTDINADGKTDILDLIELKSKILTN